LPSSDISNGNDFFDIANVTDTSYTYTDEIISGATYSFKVKARSEVGYGPYSSAVDIIAATHPSVLDAPTTILIDE